MPKSYVRQFSGGWRVKYEARRLLQQRREDRFDRGFRFLSGSQVANRSKISELHGRLIDLESQVFDLQPHSLEELLEEASRRVMRWEEQSRRFVDCSGLLKKGSRK